MKLLISLWILLIMLSIIAILMIRKDEKKYSKYLSVIVLIVSILGLIISTVSAQVQNNEFRTNLEGIVSREFVDKTFKNRVNSQNDVIFKDDLFYIDIVARKSKNGNWWRFVESDIGSTIEFCIRYENTTSELAQDVMVETSLPSNMKYVDESAYLFNTSNPKGLLSYDNPCVKAVNIGSYIQYGNAELRFKARIIDNNLVEGRNLLIIWAKISVGNNALLQCARVYVNKEEPVKKSLLD